MSIYLKNLNYVELNYVFVNKYNNNKLLLNCWYRGNGKHNHSNDNDKFLFKALYGLYYKNR